MHRYESGSKTPTQPSARKQMNLQKCQIIALRRIGDIWELYFDEWTNILVKTSEHKKTEI